MTRTDSTALRMRAFAVALSSKTFEVTPEDVTEMVTLCQQMLPGDDPFGREVLAFATGYEMHRRDRDEMQRLGADLQRAVERATWPGPPGLGRRDIDG